MNVLPSQGLGCPDRSSFCPLSSFGADGSASRCHCAHSCGKVYVYLHLSLRRVKLVTHFCVVVPVCFIRDQPDTTAVTWSLCPCTLSSTLSSFCIPPPFTVSLWPQDSSPVLHSRSGRYIMICRNFGPGSDITMSTVRLLLVAYCL